MDKTEKIPLYMRVPVYIFGTPFMLILTAVASVLISLALICGVFWVMTEFLITGESKVDKEVTFGIENKETTKDEDNKTAE